MSGGSVQKEVRWVLQPSICVGDVTEGVKRCCGVTIHCNHCTD